MSTIRIKTTTTTTTKTRRITTRMIIRRRKSRKKNTRNNNNNTVHIYRASYACRLQRRYTLEVRFKIVLKQSQDSKPQKYCNLCTRHWVISSCAEEL